MAYLGKEMKLRSILNEIGDRFSLPPGTRFQVKETNGTAKFKLGKLEYIVKIKVPLAMSARMVIVVDFETQTGGTDMTNAGNALEVMSSVVGSIEAWLKQYIKKYGPHKLVYIKYNPKSEEGSEVWSQDNLNRRDKLYRVFISKFAQKYNSSVEFDSSGGITAKFKPELTIE